MKIWPHLTKVTGNKHLTRRWADGSSNSNLLLAPCRSAVLLGSARFLLPGVTARQSSAERFYFHGPSLRLVLRVRFIDIDLWLKLSVQIPEQGEQSLYQLKSTYQSARLGEPSYELAKLKSFTLFQKPVHRPNTGWVIWLGGLYKNKKREVEKNDLGWSGNIMAVMKTLSSRDLCKISLLFLSKQM